MTMQVPLSSADARLAAGAGRAVDLLLGPRTIFGKYGMLPAWVFPTSDPAPIATQIV
jgi:hypothetical protein